MVDNKLKAIRSRVESRFALYHPVIHGESANDDLRELLAEIDELRAIVAKLPKTADGVTVVPGITVYVASEVVCSYHKHDIATGEFEEFSPQVAMVCRTGIPHLAVMSVNKCYSTREAAEKARQS